MSGPIVDMLLPPLLCPKQTSQYRSKLTRAASFGHLVRGSKTAARNTVPAQGNSSAVAVKWCCSYYGAKKRHINHW
jgi:hypothetical protein